MAPIETAEKIHIRSLDVILHSADVADDAYGVGGLVTMEVRFPLSPIIMGVDLIIADVGKWPGTAP